MTRWKKICDFLNKNNYEISYCIFGIILLLDLCHSTGETRKILFGNFAVFLFVNRLRDEIKAMRKELKDYFRNEIDRSVINHWNFLERERNKNK